MGANNSRPLAEASKEDVAQHLATLGPEFKRYASVVDDNGIDGDLLSEMDEQMFLETLDDVEIFHEVHRSRLLEEFRTCFIIEVAAQNEYAAPAAAPAPISTGVTGRSTQPVLEAPVPKGPSKEDTDRMAQIEAYALHEIEPDSDIASKLLSLLEMAQNLFESDLVDITFLKNDCQYSLTRVGLTEPLEDDILHEVYDVVNYTKDGKPFLCRSDRSVGIANYPTFSGQTFVVQDILLDDAFRWMRLVAPFRCYAASPLVTASGLIVGSLCLHNLDPRPEFDRNCEMQLEQVANMIVQSIENWKLKRHITVLESTRMNLQSTKNKSKPPQDKAVVCFVGIEEYDTLMDIASKHMKGAMEIYHKAVQTLREKYFGYEVSLSGQDRYYLVFHDAVDAFGFALDLQQNLFDADWTKEFLRIPRAGDNGAGFRGLRVKVGAYIGNVTAVKNHKTGKIEYQSIKSRTIGIAKTLFDAAYGGQILTSFGTWNVASFLAETKLGSPQVVDLGEHIIRTGKTASDGVVSERIVQLVPDSLAIDYGEMTSTKATENDDDSYTSADLSSAEVSIDQSIGDQIQEAPGLWGRHFPNIRTEKKLSPSFFDAPSFKHGGHPKVTIAFIGTSEIEKRYEKATNLVSRIIGLASSALRGTKGYQCQNNMLAFGCMKEAIDFGLDFSATLKKQEALEDGANLANLVTYGCVHDSFITLEPHKTTGRADYFGKVVNRAARVAYTSKLGSVCVGVTVTPDFKQEKFDIGHPNIQTRFVDRRKLKGVEGEVAVFECRRPRHHKGSRS